MYSPKSVDLGLTLSSCIDNKSDSTVQIPVSATPSNSNYATANRKK